MEAQQLEGLHDIHLPPEISWWPPAPGWWALAALIPLLVILAVWLYKQLTRKTALKAARTLLQEIRLDSQRNNNEKLQELSSLLRRAAIALGGRGECAGLTGEEWLEYLDRTLAAKNNQPQPFTQGIGRLLSELPYRKEQPGDGELNQLIVLCESWLKAQRKRKR